MSSATFNPSDHPRGNPANAGQFVAKSHAEAADLNLEDRQLCVGCGEYGCDGGCMDRSVADLDAELATSARIRDADIPLHIDYYAELAADSNGNVSAPRIVSSYNYNADPGMVRHFEKHFPHLDPAERDELCRKIAFANTVAGWMRAEDDKAFKAAQAWERRNRQPGRLVLAQRSSAYFGDAEENESAWNKRAYSHLAEADQLNQSRASRASQADRGSRPGRAA